MDIQALWHTQLEAGAWLARLLGCSAEADDWQSRADQVKQNFRRYFTDADHQALYDHLNTDGSPDHQIRPNQLFALTVPLCMLWAALATAGHNGAVTLAQHLVGAPRR